MLRGRTALAHVLLVGAGVALQLWLWPCCASAAATDAPRLSMALAWDPSPENDIVDYVVYYGTRSRIYPFSYHTGGQTNATMHLFKPGQHYYFAATAVNWSGWESELSQEVNQAVPSPCNEVVSLTTNWLSNLVVELILLPTPGNKYRVRTSDDGRTWTTLWLTPVAADATPLLFTDSSLLELLIKRSYRADVVGRFLESSQPIRSRPTSQPPGMRVQLDGAYGRVYELQASDDGSASWKDLWLSSPVTNAGPLEFVDLGSRAGRTYRLLEAADPEGSYWNPCGGIANDPPVLDPIPPQQTYLNVPTGPIPFSVFDPDTPMQYVVASATSSDPSIIPQDHIVFGDNGESRTISLTPAPGASGSCAITVTVFDGSQTASTTLEVEVLPYSPGQAELHVQKSGAGSVHPDLSGQILTVGKRYTLTAVPDPGQVFVGWTGSVSSDSPTLHFVMETGFVLEAAFMPNPYLVIPGAYNGLVAAPEVSDPQHAGSVSITATARGSYSGAFRLGGRKYSVSGKLGFPLTASNTVTRAGTTPLQVELAFGSNPGDPLTGRLTDGTWTESWHANRSGFEARLNPAPLQGRYTVVFPGNPDSHLAPEGAGFGSVKVDAGGVGTLAGSLADGTKLSAKVPLSKDGLWPVYTSLYHNQGFLAGWLTLTNHSTNDISGESRWARPASAKGKYYPWGFTNSLQVVGSGYLRPPASPPGSAVLTPPTGVIAFGGGNIASPFTNQIALDQKNKVLNLSPNKLSLTISLSSGLFSGRVVDPATGKSSSFKGALLQTQNVGAGFLLGTNCSARVSLGF